MFRQRFGRNNDEMYSAETRLKFDSIKTHGLLSYQRES